MRFHDRFEWDAEKARRNARKHRVTFEDAARVLGDEDADRYHIDDYDDAHSTDEERWVTTASHPDDRRIVLRVVWTERNTDEGRVTRIIGARAAKPKERSIYGAEIAKK